MLDKTAEMKRTEIKARKHARKNNLLKIMGLKEENHKRSASTEDQARGSSLDTLVVFYFNQLKSDRSGVLIFIPVNLPI